MAKMIIALRGSALIVQVQDHNSDPEKLVIKAKHPEAGALLALAAGVVDGVSTIQGSVYFVTVVPRKAFEAGLGQAMQSMLAGDLTLAAPASMNVNSPVEASGQFSDDDENGDWN